MAERIERTFLIAACGLALAVIVGLVMAAPTFAITVSMGDSYSAGEGSGQYDGGTDDGSPIGGVNRCHRSRLAWPRLLGVQQGYHLACSGATSRSFDISQGYTEPDNVGQLERLRAISAAVPVDRVLVTVGGNDLGFADIIRRCRGLLGGGACLKRLHDVELGLLRNNVRAAVRNGLRSIRGAATTGADVVLVGYPDIIPAAGRAFSNCGWLDHGEIDRLHTLEAELDSTLRSAARDASARYISVRRALVGHEMCTRASWVKPVTSAADRLVSNRQQMAHPTARGQQALATAVRRALSQEYGCGDLDVRGQTLKLTVRNLSCAQARALLLAPTDEQARVLPDRQYFYEASDCEGILLRQHELDYQQKHRVLPADGKYVKYTVKRGCVG